MNPKSLLLVGSAVIAMLALSGVVVFIKLGAPAMTRAGANARNVSARTELAGWNRAVEIFHSEWSRYPSGSVADVVAQLMGKNPKGILYVTPRRLSSTGLPLDPWNNEYHLQPVTPGEKPVFYSIGPDKTDQGGAAGSDDIVL